LAISPSGQFSLGFISGIHFGYENQSNTMGLQFVAPRILISVLYNILDVVFEVKWNTNA
jgi:hypothetical protein